MTRKTFYLGLVALFLMIFGVACGGDDSENGDYSAAEATLDPTSFTNSVQFQSDTPATTQAPNQMAPVDTTPANVPSPEGWCLNYTGEAAYPHRAKFYSTYAREWLVCRADRGGFLKSDGNIVATRIVAEMPTVGYSPWDGVTYADTP